MFKHYNIFILLVNFYVVDLFIYEFCSSTELTTAYIYIYAYICVCVFVLPYRVCSHVLTCAKRMLNMLQNRLCGGLLL